MHRDAPREFVIAGAPGDNSNLGVSTLMLSAIAGVLRHSPQSRITVFDNGWGIRPDVTSEAGKDVRFQRCGVRFSRRYHQAESLWNIRLSARFGGLHNPAARVLRTADAVLDASGGDSFTDLYGHNRFRSVLDVKRAALESGAPLVLLPQTYGPFTKERSIRAVRAVLRQVHLAYARDKHSHAALARLLDDDFDPSRHRLGVDMAFALQPQRPSQAVCDWFDEWRATDANAPVAGVNVSGLLFNDTGAQAQYGLRASYREAITDVVRALVEAGARVVLVRHVLASVRSPESDLLASTALMDALTPEQRERVVLAPELWDPREAKWLISYTDWFCGSRMHATIAALSSGVPAVAIAYSAKTAGVFETCGQEHRVADARNLSNDEIVSATMRAWNDRDSIRDELALTMPNVVARASAQLDEIVECVARPSC